MNIFDTMVNVAEIREAESFKDALELTCRMNNLSMKELAKLIGCSYTHISGVKNGSYNLTIPIASKLAELSKCSPGFWVDLWLKKEVSA